MTLTYLNSPWLGLSPRIRYYIFSRAPSCPPTKITVWAQIRQLRQSLNIYFFWSNSAQTTLKRRSTKKSGVLVTSQIF